MKDERILTIDPGVNGGMAWRDSEGSVTACPMPSGMTARCDLIRSLSAGGIRRAVIEKVGTGMPGNAAGAMTTFARHCGNLEAALYMAGISITEVLPSKWMKAIGHGVTKYLPDGYKDLPKPEQAKARARAKTANKNAIKEAMARRYPLIDVTLKTADALGMMEYAREELL